MYGCLYKYVFILNDQVNKSRRYPFLSAAYLLEEHFSYSNKHHDKRLQVMAEINRRMDWKLNIII